MEGAYLRGLLAKHELLALAFSTRQLLLLQSGRARLRQSLGEAFDKGSIEGDPCRVRRVRTSVESTGRIRLAFPCSQGQVGLTSMNHLHGNGGIHRLDHIKVCRHAVADDIRRVRCHVNVHIIRVRDGNEERDEMGVGTLSAFADLGGA